MTFYNTASERGEDLKRARDSTKKQDDQVEAFFRARPNGLFTSWMIRAAIWPENPPPYTSVARSVNTLYRAGIVEKLDQTVKDGPYNRRCCLWKFKPPEVEYTKQGTLFDMEASNGRYYPG